MDQIWEPMNVKRKNNSSYIIFLFILFIQAGLAQKNDDNSYSVMFYNVENLFDCKDDSLKRDEEFLPEGDKRWTQHRMYSKINGIAKTILACNQWNPPTIIGLCEIENEWVLKQLVYNSGLSNLRYGYIHFESQDIRGIDVALLYRKEDFSPLLFSPIRLSQPVNEFHTRDALYIKGTIASDTLHIIVNHWPSKRGGVNYSEPKREAVAKVINATIDSIKSTCQHPKLIVMGDFNATTDAKSLQSLIKYSELTGCLNEKELKHQDVAGTYKYKGQWDTIDHILFSSSGFKKSNYNLCQTIVQLPFLTEEDNSYSGLKPKRTYAGPRYIGGISDHLPILLTIEKTVD